MKNKEITNNPFSSVHFSQIWVKHFGKSTSPVSFAFLKGVNFIPHRYLPLYFNIGKTDTKGIFYSVNENAETSLGNKVLIIYDIPNYFGVVTENLPKNIRINKLRQYPGYRINLIEFDTFEDYLNVVFNGKSRNKLRGYKRKIESTFKINSRIYFGNISKKMYYFIFEECRKLLLKRFEEKKISNNNLNMEEWSFYKEVMYPMILEKKASIFVMFDAEKPIGIMLNFMTDEMILGAITVFDIDYRNYNVGTVNIMNLIAWSLENNYKILDFSKGHYDYKTRWGSTKYDFEYHILHNSSSVYSTIIALFLKSFFQLKQYLREKQINELLHRISFRIKKN